MDDKTIVELYWHRDERAITYTDQKYGQYCGAIAYRILGNQEDADESVNDTYLRAWNTIPPTRPSRLSVFLGKITRNLAIDRWRRTTAQKRGAGNYELALEELQYCISGSADLEQQLLHEELSHWINQFLQELPLAHRRVFIRRYWHFCSIPEIATQYGYSVAKTRSILYRTRKRLRDFLAEKGVMLDES